MTLNAHSKKLTLSPRRNAPNSPEKVYIKEDPKTFEEVIMSPDEIKLVIHEDNDTESVFIGPKNKPLGYEELDRNKPTQKKKYPNLKNKYASATRRKYENSEWPSQDECKKHVSR